MKRGAAEILKDALAANTRWFLLRRFPFFIVYRVSSRRVQVLAVAHAPQTELLASTLR